MHQLTNNLPVWRDCDKDWDAEFAKYLAENKTLAYMMFKKAKIFKDADVLTQKNINGQWESLNWTEFADRFTA